MNPSNHRIESKESNLLRWDWGIPWIALGLFAVHTAVPGTLAPQQTALAQCNSIVNDTNFNGNDLQKYGGGKGVHADSLSACCALCNADPECYYFSYREDAAADPGSTNCHPKSSDAGRGPHAGTTSGTSVNKPRPSDGAKNIVFLVCESIDGRTFHDNSPVPLPNVHKLRETGVNFESHYCTTPVCAPSRASIFSGRAPHHIPHTTWGNVSTDVVWGNGEGLPPDYDELIHNVLDAAGYQTKISGKTDWTTGGHAEWNWMQWWTMYARFPFTVGANESSQGWDEQPDPGTCRSNGTVTEGERSHIGDWQTLNETVAWIRQQNATTVARDGPFFAYQGMNIVHPPYVTVTKWFNAIDDDRIEVPEWEELGDMHPCDFQSTMLKGCIPDGDAERALFYSKARRHRIRKIYYAMIAEFDAMVGEYMAAVKDTGLWETTVFIVTADHGDMNMEHQQFYKMVPYDAASSVPLVVSAPGVVSRSVRTPTSHLSLFPTILDIAKVPRSAWPAAVEGESLYKPVFGTLELPSDHTAVSQFHGADIAMSWYLVRQGHFKLVVWGTNTEVDAQLFNITADPSENVNLISEPELQPVVARLDAALLAHVNYTAVSLAGAKYFQDVFRVWQAKQGDQWVQRLSQMPSWKTAWQRNPDGALRAITDWIDAPPTVNACRGAGGLPPNATLFRRHVMAY
eukprot:g223.t1